MGRCCEVRRRLAEEYATAARVYAEAVVMLTRNQANSHIDYSRLREAAEKARERSEATRVAFEEHIDLHQCGTAQKVPGGRR